MLGVAIGILIVYYWPQITQILPGVG